MLWPKKNSYKKFDNEKKFLRLENSPPSPHNISNGPSLRLVYNQSQSKTIKTNQTCILYSISTIFISNLVRRSVFLTTIPPATV